ncbi:hypothetical protein B0H10DRAFT_893201 [Mycena sp. CBHHK59/15]|nr:hypothetical protein B0H10DRAFT_893201 [Mycena sp. CBHHK59/15]
MYEAGRPFIMRHEAILALGAGMETISWTRCPPCSTNCAMCIATWVLANPDGGLTLYDGVMVCNLLSLSAVSIDMTVLFAARHLGRNLWMIFLTIVQAVAVTATWIFVLATAHTFGPKPEWNSQPLVFVLFHKTTMDKYRKSAIAGVLSSLVTHGFAFYSELKNPDEEENDRRSLLFNLGLVSIASVFGIAITEYFRHICHEQWGFGQLPRSCL